MKKQEIKKLTKTELVKNIDKFKKDLFNFRFQKMNSQVTNPAKISQTKSPRFQPPPGAPVETQPRRGRRRGSTEPEKRIKKILGAIAPKIFFDESGGGLGELCPPQETYFLWSNMVAIFSKSPLQCKQ